MNPTPPPNRIADELETLAQVLRTHGTQALDQAADYAGGYPATTIGDGAPRGTSELTTTEAAADRPDRLAAQNIELRLALRLTWTAALRAQDLIASTLGHADPDSATRTTHGAGPAGTGFCALCGRHVTGTPTDRLRAGWCDNCGRAWRRAGRPDRGLFAHRRRRELSAIDGDSTNPQVSPHA